MMTAVYTVTLMTVVLFYLATSLIQRTLQFGLSSRESLCKFQDLTRDVYEYDHLRFHGLKVDHFNDLNTIMGTHDPIVESLQFEELLPHLQNPVVSTRNQADLVVDQELDEVTLNHVRSHGVAIVQDVISKDTVAELRATVLAKSNADWAAKKATEVIILDSENRWHGMPSVGTPSVRRLLRELGEHDVVRPLLERIIGRKASMVSFSVIRANFGSVDQDWHTDSGLVSTPGGYSQPFVFDGWTLVIPLQDVEEKQGNTGVCPSVWVPNGDSPSIDNFWHDANNDPENPNWERGHADEMCIHVKQKAGDGLLYKHDLTHRGSAHLRPDKEDRLSLFIMFSEPRQGSGDKRWLVGSDQMFATFTQTVGLWGWDLSAFWLLDLGLPGFLWRVPYTFHTIKTYAKHILALTVWETTEELPVDFIDAWCLLFKGRNIDAFGSDNDGNGFFLVDYEAIVEGAEFWIPIVQKVVIGAGLGALLVYYVAGRIKCRVWGESVRSGANGKHHFD